MKLAAVVVTFYPDINETILFIEKYIEYVDHLIIWENTPVKDYANYKIEIPDHDNKITYMGTGSNEGIGYALNRAIEWSVENNFTHLLTMDQDSCFDKNEFIAFQKFVNDTKKNDIVIFSPVLPGILTESNSEIIDVKFSITSGSILNLSVSEKIGLFREDFFIDAIDTEYSIRSLSMGYRTVLFTKCLLIQKFGDARKTKFGFMSADYSVFRTYHMVRNHIIVWKLFPKHFSFFEASKIYIFQRIIKIILAEPNKWAKLKSILKGFNDGLANNILPIDKVNIRINE